MNQNHYPCVATFAGTDPTGGAGIQADIKAISATGGYAASIITALVSQNTLGVQGIFDIPLDFVQQQIDSVFSDLSIKTAKVGMLHNEKIIEIVAAAFHCYQLKQIVIDPVMIAKHGALLLAPSALHLLLETIFPQATLITPNIMEAETILGKPITQLSEMEDSAIALGQKFKTNILVKGGHLDTRQASDVLYAIDDKSCHWFHAERIATKNTHGTGCTLSSAIASYLAQGESLQNSIRFAKSYLTSAIRAGSQKTLGQGYGPVDHFYFLQEESCVA